MSVRTLDRSAGTLDALRRVLLVLLAAGMAIAGAQFLVGALAFVDASTVEIPGLAFRYEPTRLPWALRMRWVAGAVFAIGAAFLLVRLAVSGRPPVERWFEISSHGARLYGRSRVRVSENAMRALVASSAETVTGVIESDPTLLLNRKGWQIRCPLIVSPDASLTTLVPEVSRAVRDALHKHTGIEVDDVLVDARLEAQHAQALR